MVSAATASAEVAGVRAILRDEHRSIAAVLAPARTDALYFVADGKGGHVFSATLKDGLAFLVMLFILLLRPEGIFGKAVRTL